MLEIQLKRHKQKGKGPGINSSEDQITKLFSSLHFPLFISQPETHSWFQLVQWPSDENSVPGLGKCPHLYYCSQSPETETGQEVSQEKIKKLTENGEGAKTPSHQRNISLDSCLEETQWFWLHISICLNVSELFWLQVAKKHTTQNGSNWKIICYMTSAKTARGDNQD